MKELHLISAATGSLAFQIIRAAATQFASLQVDIVTHIFVDTQEKLRTTLEQIESNDTWIFHALLDPDAKSLCNQLCDERGIPHFDLTSNILSFFAEQSGMQPEYEPVVKVDSHYFDRLDALEFTLQHDDSRRLESMGEADIILVGISRVSKTPTSIYLGGLGFRVANISFVPSIGIPDQLKDSYGKKVVALTIQPRRLHEIRHRRMVVNQFESAMKDSGKDEIDYLNLKNTIHEVMEAERIYRERGYAMVNITDQTIEATSSMILDTLELHRPVF